MGASNSTGKTAKFYTLKQKAGAKEEDTPKFWLTEKIGDKWTATQSFDTMEGNLNWAKIVEKEFKPGIKSRMFEIELQADDWVGKITLPHGSLTYSILSSIATDANSLNMYKITVKKVKSKDGKYWNAQGYVNVNGERDMQKWAVAPNDAPKPIPVMVDGVHFEVNGEKQYDRSKVKAFWEQLFTEKIASKLTGNGTSSAPATAVQNTATTGTVNAPAPVDTSYTQLPDEDMDQLPF